MVKFAPFDAADYLDSEETIAEYLTAALEDPNPDVFLAAVRDVARSWPGATRQGCRPWPREPLQGSDAWRQAPLGDRAQAASRAGRQALGKASSIVRQPLSIARSFIEHNTIRHRR